MRRYAKSHSFPAEAGDYQVSLSTGILICIEKGIRPSFVKYETSIVINIQNVTNFVIPVVVYTRRL